MFIQEPTLKNTFPNLEVLEIRNQAWLTWWKTSCPTHLSGNCGVNSGAKRTKSPIHLHRMYEANKLGVLFTARCASSQLLPLLTRKLQQLYPIQQQIIQDAIHTQAESDSPFTERQLTQAISSEDTVFPSLPFRS